MTECSQETFAFTAHFSRRVEAGFTAGRISSDGGAILLREADRKIGLLRRLEGCFVDRRHPKRIVHRVREMLAQRIFGIAMGYEDLNDHEQLRTDPLVALLSGKSDLEEDLAGKSTLNRLELVGRSERYHKIDYSAEAIDRLLVDLYLQSHPQPPEEVVLDLDATDIPLYGHQPERFFHGYYDSYCYLPLYIFAGDQLLGVRLRPSNQDASAGSLYGGEPDRGTTPYPLARSPDRAPGRFGLLPGRDHGLVRSQSSRLPLRLGAQRALVPDHSGVDGASPSSARVEWQAGPLLYRVCLPHLEQLVEGAPGGRQSRVPGKRGESALCRDLSPTEEWPAQNLYEKLYCARGDMENRIKEQLHLFADRLSTAQMASNQLRLYFSALAYTLVEALRRLALRGTDWAEAQVDTLRIKLFKIGTLVRVSVRRVFLSMSSAYPWKSLFTHVFRVLRC
ncbi:transposase [Methylacidimicrobium sp. AP8]|nr:transposase [Methylacidimicrobium sp. AP8]